MSEEEFQRALDELTDRQLDHFVKIWEPELLESGRRLGLCFER